MSGYIRQGSEFLTIADRLFQEYPKPNPVMDNSIYDGSFFGEGAESVYLMGILGDRVGGDRFFAGLGFLRGLG